MYTVIQDRKVIATNLNSWSAFIFWQNAKMSNTNILIIKI